MAIAESESSELLDVSPYEGGNMLYSGIFRTTDIRWISANLDMREGKAFWHRPVLEQWPCRFWFHVPTEEEWEEVVSIVDDLWLTESIHEALLLPKAWKKTWLNTDVDVWDEWYYHTRIPNSNWTENVFHPTSEWSEFLQMAIKNAISVRWFKNNPVVPTTSWERFPSWTRTRLPHEYQEVEYIESSGTQYIATQITPTNTTWLYMKLISKNVSSDEVYCWAATDNQDNWNKFWIWNTSSKMYFWWNSWTTSSNRPSVAAGVLMDVELNYMNSRYSKKDWTNVDNLWTLNTIWYSLNIFWHNWANTAQYFSEIKLFNLKVSDGNNIIADFVPCYRVSDWTIWLYDLVEWKFYTNSWTWTFVKWAPVNVWQMPEGYTELQYIQSSWASNTDWQYVDTWYMPNNNTEFELSMSNWSNASWSFQLFWQDTSWTTWDQWTSVVTDNYSWNWPNTNEFTHWFRDWNFHLLLLNNSWLYRDWTLIHNWRAGQTFQSSITCAIFCLHRWTAYIERSSYRFHYMKIRESWDLKRDYVPCIRDSDGVLWLYDLITNTFLSNQWTWSFVAWPVVFRSGFKVSTNTMIYTPMDTDLLDHSLNERSITNVWITLDTSVLQNKWVWFFNWTVGYGLQFTWAEFWNNDFTISWREKTLQNSTGAWSRFSSAWDTSYWCWVLVWYNHTYLYAWTWWSSRNIVNGSQIFNSTPNTRVHRVLVKEWSNWKTYRNNVLFGSASGSWSVWYNTSVIWNYRPWDMNPFHWYMSDFILEKKAWTDQQREDYFNATKALYWVS